MLIISTAGGYEHMTSRDDAIKAHHNDSEMV